MAVECRSSIEGEQLKDVAVWVDDRAADPAGAKEFLPGSCPHPAMRAELAFPQPA
jgi:hypothetical protein